MGFFSRKSDPPDDTASSKENGRPSSQSTESAFKSLRSRFQVYAKKQERDSPPPMFVQATSVAQTLSPSQTPIANRHLQLKLKLSSSSPALNPSRSQSRSERARSANNSPTRNTQPMQAQAAEADPRPSTSRSRALGTKASSSSLAATPTRKPTDAVTTTLAQRLNELAVAHSEGLLNDDEYRLLRQDLFQRFASTTPVPTEVSVVPQQKLRPTVRTNGSTIPADKRQSIDSRRLSISTSSNFIVDKQRTPSVHSRSSMTSGVASFFRRATNRKSSHDFSDSSSIFSATSAAPSERFKRLSKKTSDSSLATDRGDTTSISSRRTNNLSSPTEPSNPPASIRSVRRLPTPPSSFPTRLPGVESRYAGMAPEPEPGTDAENPETVQALRRQILTVEAEGRRLMDAFSGLELSTLTRRRRTAVTNPRDSVATLVPDARSVYSIRRSHKGSDVADGDAASMRSATSAGTAPSITSRRGTHGGATLKSGGPVVHAAGFVSSPNSSRVGSLHRKNSGSSMTSATSRLGIGSGPNGSGNAGLTVPPVPSLPLGMSLGQMGSTPSLSRSSGHLPMGVVHENEAVLTVDLDDEREFAMEMEDLRRRREEVAARYEARLEYLRAKLKGAELHEKLLSK